MRRWTIFLVIVLMLLTAAGAFACPMCKDSVPSSDAQAVGGVPSGFNNTIYLMLGGLLCVIGMITFTLIKGAQSSVHARALRNSEES
jgi:hypothetical protein